ncbi:MAG TPA: hypothetical protein VN200_11170, partial [Rhodoglobus sp.]|nr:hypothetical protein [Rhodoglobus sp.]
MSATARISLPIALLAAASMALGVAPATGAEPVSVRFEHTGAQASWTVPDGVTSIGVALAGASGADRAGFESVPGGGGAGGALTATIPVVPGETLLVLIGEQGDYEASPRPVTGNGTGIWGVGGGGSFLASATRGILAVA